MTVYLRELEEKDAPLMLEWMHDESQVEFLAADFRNKKIEDCLEFIRGSRNQEQSVNMAICDEQDEYLGTVSLKNIDPVNKNAEYAIAMRAMATGTGAAGTATDEILRYAFEELGLNRVYLNVLEKNVRADRFYRKMGFRYEGKFTGHLLNHGEFCDLKWYAIMKTEYWGRKGETQ
ncbi:MAG: GNAT family N-acetyltransferase [Clostridiales bacterium]|nr:GNAT family N-acetyltransferase [Clostridiales bacterium]